MHKRSEPPGLKVRLMLPEDAPGVVELYRSVYGEEYPVKTVYDVAEIIRQQENGDMLRIVGVTADNQVVGQLALYQSCVSNPQLYEHGQAIVRSSMRNQGLLEQFGAFCENEVFPNLLDQVWAEAVCNHLFTQKAAAKKGWYETGIELDLMPADSYAKEQSSTGRVSSLLMHKTINALFQTLYLPEIYAERLIYLYSVYDFGHTFLPAEAPLPDEDTRGHLEVYTGAGVARITILEVGSDLEAYLTAQEEEALSQNACILQIYLNLASPSSGAAVEILRKHQYFLGGVLPRWFNTDGLLMQKLTHEPGYEDIQLYSDRSRQILQMIKEDRDSVMK